MRPLPPALAGAALASGLLGAAYLAHPLAPALALLALAGLAGVLVGRWQVALVGGAALALAFLLTTDMGAFHLLTVGLLLAAGCAGGAPTGQLRGFVAATAAASAVVLGIVLQARFEACLVADGPMGGFTRCSTYLLPDLAGAIAGASASLVALAWGKRAVPLLIGAAFLVVGAALWSVRPFVATPLVFGALLLAAGLVAPGRPASGLGMAAPLALALVGVTIAWTALGGDLQGAFRPEALVELAGRHAAGVLLPVLALAATGAVLARSRRSAALLAAAALGIVLLVPLGLGHLGHAVAASFVLAALAAFVFAPRPRAAGDSAA